MNHSVAQTADARKHLNRGVLEIGHSVAVRTAWCSKVAEALERQAIKLLLTPEGLRTADPAVLTCTGDNCPKLVDCPGAECSFPIKK